MGTYPLPPKVLGGHSIFFPCIKIYLILWLQVNEMESADPPDPKPSEEKEIKLLCPNSPSGVGSPQKPITNGAGAHVRTPIDTTVQEKDSGVVNVVDPRPDKEKEIVTLEPFVLTASETPSKDTVYLLWVKGIFCS